MRTIDQARQELRAALQAGDARAARRALRGIPPIRDPDAGLLWTELLWGLPDLPDRVPVAQTLLDAFPERGEIVRPCAEILLDAVGAWVPGEPPKHPEYAQRAAQAIQTCLSLRPEYDEQARALLLQTRAAALARDPQTPEAWVEAAWEHALNLAPDSGGTWYGAGLWLKQLGRFEPALASFLRARDFLGAGEAILWNIGICATGAARPDIALHAWQALGIPVQIEGGGVRLSSPSPRMIRLVTNDLVYGDPEAPREAHAIELLPRGPCDGTLTRASGPWAEGQAWLHDGAPLGSWTDEEGQERPILPALAPLDS